MHYQIGSSTSSCNHKSWAAHKVQSGPNSQAMYGHSSDRWSAPSAPSGQILNAPHLRTVSLPHPNSTPHQSPMSYQRSSAPHHSMIVLHSLLSYGAGPNLRFNVTRDIAEVQLRPSCQPAMLWESAIHPPVSHMTIIIPIPGIHASTIEVVNPRGVTVHDVLVKIREMLYRGDRTSRSCIDLLGPKVFFAGLTRARDGSDHWEIHFSQSA